MDTIKSKGEITTLFQKGRRISTPNLTLIVLRNEKQHGHSGRAAFIAGKRLGNAVWRNRAKRRMRALCFDLNGPFSGYDVIFLAKKSTNEVPYSEMKGNVERALVRYGLR